MPIPVNESTQDFHGPRGFYLCVVLSYLAPSPLYGRYPLFSLSFLSLKIRSKDKRWGLTWGYGLLTA